jgi:hypothetical protein
MTVKYYQSLNSILVRVLRNDLYDRIPIHGGICLFNYYIKIIDIQFG